MDSQDAVERYLLEIEHAIARISRSDVRAIVDLLEAAWRERRTIYIIGNGGSASTASHMMNDLNKFTAMEGCPRVRAIALTDNVPLMTAYGNDCSYEDVFVEPLKNMLEPADIVIAISGSGNSPNIVKAAEYAIEFGATVVGLCGSPGGALAKIAHRKVVIPAEHIGQQEDGHLILNHTIAMALRERIAAHTAREHVR